MNIRTFIARLVTTFDLEFPPGEDGSRFMVLATERFAMNIEEMPIVLSKCKQ
jgi:tryprostatin B 6-hydroxylase